ncbi:hypothetical protein SAMN06296386_1242 [Lachnospiraceae bacterium]|nr:hypothetical protein SAMN06296386_1242 [Lachnospiraceae bacterium]
MYKISIDEYQEIMTYSDFFPGPIPDLQEEIKRIDLAKTISAICELITVRNKVITSKIEIPFIGNREVYIPYQALLKSRFCGIKPDSPIEIFSDDRLKKSKHIVALQPMLILLKALIKYTDDLQIIRTDFDLIDDDYRQAIKLGLIVAEELNKKDKTMFSASNFLYGTYHINVDHNVAAEIVRSYYLFAILNRNIDLFNEDVKREYRDYWTAFSSKYEYSIEEYLFVCFRELQQYYDTDAYLSYHSTWFDPHDTYAGTKMESIASMVIEDISTSPESLKMWCTDTYDEIWNFQSFLSTPFIKSSNGMYISISDFTLKNIFFENLFWKVRECFPHEDSRTMAFYGRLYEKYIQDQTESVVAKANAYKYIDEFSYGKGEGKKSSDAYIKKGTKLLAIEAKGFSVLFDCLQNKSVDRNLEKLYIKPILQADIAFANNKERDEFIDVNELYIVSVTMDSINAVPGYIEKCSKVIYEKHISLELKGFYNISIEEYEMLMFLIENGADIFSIMGEYLGEATLMPFSNYLKKYSSEKIEMTSFMKQKYNEFAEKMKSAYWK